MANTTAKTATTKTVAAKEEVKTTAKAAPAKAETKTAAKAEPKKAETKTAAKAEPVKAETKTAAKAEPKKAATKTVAKAEPKKAATKTAAKAEPKKAAAPAKKAAKKENNVYVQFAGHEFDTAEIEKAVKADYTAKNGKKTMTSVNIYVKPEDMKAYYVIDGIIGDVAL